MKLNYETKQIEGTYEETKKNIGNFKFYQCLYDSAAKRWRLPIDPFKLQQLEEWVEKWNEMEANRKKAIWKQACENLNIKYTKQGTPEYDLVKTEFKKLLQENI